MASEDIDKTSFISHYGLYRFRRIPFGLMNAPGNFQRACDIILASVKRKHALVYLDDVIVYLDTLEEKFDHLDSVLRLLRDTGSTLKLPKCHFFKTSVDYLVHIVAHGRLEVAERATEAVDKELQPRNATELRSILSLFHIYRRLAPHRS